MLYVQWHTIEPPQSELTEILYSVQENGGHFRLVHIEPRHQIQTKHVFCYNCGKKGHFGHVSHAILTVVSINYEENVYVITLSLKKVQIECCHEREYL